MAESYNKFEKLSSPKGNSYSNEESNETIDLDKYSIFHLYDTIKVNELLSEISLAGFQNDCNFVSSPRISNQLIYQLSDLNVGQMLDGTVESCNRLGSLVDVGVTGCNGFLHKANTKGYSLPLGSKVNVEVTSIDLPRNKITLNLNSIYKNDQPAIDPALLNISSKMSCNVCLIDFENREEQVQHYKLDWHRYNLKQKIMGGITVNESTFDNLANNDELSSLSGSDSKSDNESESTGHSTSGNETVGSPRRIKLRCKLTLKNRLPQRERSDSVTSTDTEYEDDKINVNSRFNPKLFLRNKAGKMVALYRCVIHGKENIPEDQNQLLNLVQTVPSQMKWAIILLGGGHFAAAVFDGVKPILHKTFHRYTVRAKQGGAQGSKDAKGGLIKSGGASLRRYNEAALVREIQDLMTTWNSELQSCHRVFFRAAGFNRTTLFGGKNAIFKKTDIRMRTIPFPTRRATFSEVQRIHKLLSMLECFGDCKLYENSLPRSPKVYLGNKSPKKPSQRSKMILPTKLEALPDVEDTPNDNVVNEDDDEETELTLVEEVINNVNDLKEFECTKKFKKKRGKRKSSLPRHQEDPISTPLDGEEYQLRTALYSACKLGNCEKLLGILQLAQSNSTSNTNTYNKEEENNNASVEAVNLDNYIPIPVSDNSFSFSLSLLNEPFGEGGTTFLHLAAKEGHKEIVKILLENGANPCSKNKMGHTPYIVTADKDTRNEFRRYWDANPNKYDYSKSQIPGPLSEEQEKEKQAKQLERNKERKKVKKDRLKDRKLEIATRKAEEEEQKRFAALSDREKRALAAEKRILADSGKNANEIVILSRCFLCAIDITGKVPFEYNNCCFCSIKCVKEHRKNNPN